MPKEVYLAAAILIGFGLAGSLTTDITMIILTGCAFPVGMWLGVKLTKAFSKENWFR
jgi:hypothetical protein